VRFENTDKLEAFQDRLKALPNAVVIDWSRLKYPDELFEDTVHLRHDGAIDFSRKLADKIGQVLKERHGQTETRAEK
jgi:lysophospholipase L1-like esterase